VSRGGGGPRRSSNSCPPVRDAQEGKWRGRTGVEENGKGQEGASRLRESKCVRGWPSSTRLETGAGGRSSILVPTRTLVLGVVWVV